MLVNRVATGGGNLWLTVNQGGRLQIFESDITGNGYFEANEMDFLGAPASLFGTGQLYISTNYPGNGILVKPYGYLVFDDPDYLEMDIDKQARIAFSERYFLRNVIFVLPVIDLYSGVQIGDLNLARPSEEGGGGTFVSLFADLERVGSENGVSFNRDIAEQLEEKLGASPLAVSNLFGSLAELVFSGVLGFEEFEAIFAPYFGFHPSGLQGLMPDLFDRLAESLEVPVESEDLPAGDQVSAPGADSPIRGATELELRATRGYAPEVANSWDSSVDDELDDRPSVLLALQMLPMAFTGLVGRVKDRTRWK